MKTIEILPLPNPVERSVTVPGSKSLTNRALIMASLASGVSLIKNHSRSEDSLILIRALRKLGIVIFENKGRLKVIGNAGQFKPFDGHIFVGNAGTATRFLTSLITLVPGRIVIDKSKRMEKRPIVELNMALKKIKTGKISIRGDVSSQFISSLLMIAPLLKNGLSIKIIGEQVSRSYIDMTIDMMKKFGIEVKNDDFKSFHVRKNQKYKAINYKIDGDATGASYFWAIAAITGSKIKVKNINPRSSQGDLKFSGVLKKMGCRVRKNIKGKWIEVQGNTKLNGIEVDMASMPDTAQTLAVTAAFVKGMTKITGLQTLRVKETNRLTALEKELKKIGIESEITNSSIIINGGFPHGAAIRTYGDHRMAMAFAVLGTRIKGIKIQNPEVVNKSFPDFWNKLKSLGIKMI